MNQNCTSWLKHIKFIHTLNHAGSIKIKIADIHLGAFLLKKLLIAQPLPDDMLEEEMLTKLQNRNQILNKVKDYIDTNLQSCAQIMRKMINFTGK